MTDWQPIETAPKDGTYVLLARNHEILGVGDYWVPDQEQRCDGSCESWFIHNGTETADPTHWMPLPSPPSSEPASGSNIITDGKR